jgi:HAD superfamily hydrolase (TIGR01490 family)
MRSSTPLPRLALFDLDHTLLSGDSDVLWIDFLIAKALLDGPGFARRNAAIAASYQLGTVDAQAFADFYVGTLAARTPDELEPLRQEFLKTEIIPRIPQDALNLVARHQSGGDLVVLTTATNRFITALTADYLGIEHVIATEPGMQNGEFTGRSQGQLNMREGKVLRLNAWLGARGQNLAEFDSTAYSDSINDLPLLKAVNHAVAVDPDPRLRAEALMRSWKVLPLRR